MTATQTKYEINEEFHNVKYILTSNIRTKLILSVYESPKNLDDLRNELKKPSATILHGLKELENINLVQKTRKTYHLTSNGHLLATNMIKLIENWYAIHQNKDFWNSHDLTGIPDSLLKRMYLLKDVEYVTSTTSDLSNAFNRYIKLIGTSDDLKIILPIYSENHIKQLIKNLSDGKIKHLELIVSDNVLSSIKRKKTFEDSLLNNENVEIHCIKSNPKLYLTCCEEFMSLTLFFKDGYYDDSQILIGKTDESKEWSQWLFDYFKGF